VRGEAVRCVEMPIQYLVVYYSVPPPDSDAPYFQADGHVDVTLEGVRTEAQMLAVVGLRDWSLVTTLADNGTIAYYFSR
jgi:hypothetical protein